VNINIGYIDGKVKQTWGAQPELMDGSSFYSLTLSGTTEKGEVFSVSVYSRTPIALDDGADLPWD
jgi:hypothetical protein